MENLDNATHKVVITIGSVDASEDVGVQISLDPEIEGQDYEAMGFQPASHQFLHKFVLPLLENIYMRSEFPELFDSDGPTQVN